MRKFHDLKAINWLRDQGVEIPIPQQVFIEEDVPLTAIAPSACLMAGTRISGKWSKVERGAVVGEAANATIINSQVGKGSRLGVLGPLVLRDSCIGPNCVLASGHAEKAVILGGDDGDVSKIGAGFSARNGTLFEENVCVGQYSDTKMSILFPWVSLGSQVNWCETLTSGGTGSQRGLFTEIGSGTVHFNYTPRGDKATASCFGNVSQGVFLNREPIFIGGNASLIGPITAEFGAITPAGGVYKEHLPCGLNIPCTMTKPVQTVRPFQVSYHSIQDLYQRQMYFVAELCALEVWYRQVRLCWAESYFDLKFLYEQGLQILKLNLDTRLVELTRLAERMPRLLRDNIKQDAQTILQQEAFIKHWQGIRKCVNMARQQTFNAPPLLLENLARSRTGSYTKSIAILPAEVVQAGTAWLNNVVRSVFPASLQELASITEENLNCISS